MCLCPLQTKWVHSVGECARLVAVKTHTSLSGPEDAKTSVRSESVRLSSGAIAAARKVQSTHRLSMGRCISGLVILGAAALAGHEAAKRADGADACRDAAGTLELCYRWFSVACDASGDAGVSGLMGGGQSKGDGE
jgi:hypothetical protein